MADNLRLGTEEEEAMCYKGDEDNNGGYRGGGDGGGDGHGGGGGGRRGRGLFSGPRHSN